MKKFEVTSKNYFLFLWAVLLAFLAVDCYWLWGVLAEDIQFNTGSIVGIIIRTSILLAIIFKRGPLIPLVIVWGILLILSGLSGYYLLVTALDITPIHIILIRTLHLAIGFILIYFLGRSVTMHNK